MVVSDKMPATEPVKDNVVDEAKNAGRELKSASSTSTKIEDEPKTSAEPTASPAGDKAADNESRKGTTKSDETAAGSEREKGQKVESQPPAERAQTPPKENSILSELKTAFPNIEEKIVKAVLIASQGVLDPAFNALLFLSDPTFEEEAALPTQPVPAVAQAAIPTSQLQQDEMLARQLDEQFNRKDMRAERAARERRIREREEEFQRKQQQLRSEYGGYGSDDEDFIDVLNRGLQETSKKVGRWWEDIKKNFNEELDGQDARPGAGPQRARQQRFNSFGARDNEAYPTEQQLRGVSLHDDDDDEPAPRLPPRRTSTGPVPARADGPNVERKRWQPLPPEPVSAPTKVTAGGQNHAQNSKRDPDQDDYLINSDDEL
ncbi:AaceriACR083Cp [[Ashbya] aceris (nom. inval.)]|nr:AaceriACR083Cp [[Ashbya] aceris (nom. inval.)]